MIWTSTAFR